MNRNREPRTCALAACGKTFVQTTARKMHGRGGLVVDSSFCSTECREVARLGRAKYEAQLAAGVQQRDDEGDRA